MRHETVTFAGAHGDLVGVVDMPDKEPESVGLFAHCFTGGKESPAARRIAGALAARGLAVLRFDFAGIGDSSGEFPAATFTSNVADLVRAAEHLAATYGAPSLLLGHSLGGASAIAAVQDLPEVRALVTIGAPSDPAHVTHLFADAMADIHETGAAEVVLAGRPFQISKEFVEDLGEQRQLDRIGRLGCPLLILHSPEDEIVGIDQAGRIYGAARHPRSFIALDGANHLLTRPRDAERVAQLVAAWADPYLPDTFTPEID